MKHSSLGIELPIILLGSRVCVKNDLKCSPVELEYGQALRLLPNFSKFHLNKLLD